MVAQTYPNWYPEAEAVVKDHYGKLIAGIGLVTAYTLFKSAITNTISAWKAWRAVRRWWYQTEDKWLNR